MGLLRRFARGEYLAPKGPSVNNIQTEDEVCQRCFKPKSQHHTQEINGRIVCVEWFNKSGKELRDIPKEYSGPKPPWLREGYVPRPKGKGGGKGDRSQPRGGRGAQVNNAEETKGEEMEATDDGDRRKMSEEELHAISSVATQEIWERIHGKQSPKGIGMVKVAKAINSSTIDERNTRERELEEEMARLNECEEKTWDEPTVREGEASMSRW